jgi:SulP family sulfate permease
MTNSRHHSNGELFGQGVGNILAPFFGGITATAAIARSAANVKAGAKSPVSAIIHSLMVLVAIVFLARWLSYLPLASMAALLLMVAWNMSEAHKVVQMLKSASWADIMVLLLCTFLTIFMDMVIAISFGVVLASLLFMREMAKMTVVSDLSRQKQWHHQLPDGWKGIRISGPLFFAAADRVFSQLQEEMGDVSYRGIILMMDGVSVLDAGGLAGFERFCKELKQKQIRLIVAEIQFQPLRTLVKAKFRAVPRRIEFTSSLEEALEMAK